MQITRQLHGRLLQYAATNGELLVIRCTDGFELQVAWVDDNGKRLQGMPLLMFAGTHIKAKRVNEIKHRREVGL